MLRMQFKSFLLNANNVEILIKMTNSNICSNKILKHFSSIDKLSNLELFPSDLKKITTMRSPQLFVANEDTAVTIAKAIQPHYVNTVPFYEMDPGPCILTKALLQHLKPTTLGLINKSECEEFSRVQQRLQKSHKSQIFLKTLKYHWNNFIPDHSTKQQWHENIVGQLFVNHSSSDLVYRLINGVIWQRNYFANGRIEIFAIVPAIDLKKLTADTKCGYSLYTQKSCLFQILFEYEVLAEISKFNFLPWYNAKPAFRGKIECNWDSFFLMRICPRKDLLSVWQPDELPLLKFFVNHCFFRRTAYIISILEKWIPGIGIKLITSKFEELNSNSQKNLTDTFHMFTKCGSITPHQICTVFKYFQQLPEYETSSFHQQCKDFYKFKSHKAKT